MSKATRKANLDNAESDSQIAAAVRAGDIQKLRDIAVLGLARVNDLLDEARGREEAVGPTEPVPPSEDDYPPITDDLLPLGFKFCDDGEAMSHKLGVNGGPEVVVSIETSAWADNHLHAKTLSLYWSAHRSGSDPGTISMSFTIRDNPTLGQIKTLLTALKGE